MLRLLIKEYLSKCQCCDECIAQCYCIRNHLRNDLVPRDYCVDNMAGYLKGRVGNSNGALSNYIAENTQPQDLRLAKIEGLMEGTIDHFSHEDAMDLLYEIKEVLRYG